MFGVAPGQEIRFIESTAYFLAHFTLQAAFKLV